MLLLSSGDFAIELPTPEQLLVKIIVIAAAVYVARQYFWKKRQSCGGCEGCPTSTETSPAETRSELIQLETAPDDPTRKSG